ncbi:peptidoglycan DD-metalloendopeptidase family protein [Glutamicibacter sp. NPDC087344]|uniref:peptidoglycan DD-metalloendopeptidase family protein n=1 Tax=Glutamicibacter sp. NPDC087344 TaxID=3363994 RepID=UPI00382ABF9C
MATPAEFIKTLKNHTGTKYTWGGKTPHTGFDCSGLIHYALAEVGVKFVHGSLRQLQECEPISVAQALRTPGALLWFQGHDAISLGDGKTIEAVTSPANGVGTYPHGNRFTKAGLIPGITYEEGNTMGMISPTKGTVSSEWSKNRKHPVTGKVTSHAGIDIAAPTGTDVVAAFGGVVEEIRTDSYPGDKRLWKGLKSGNFVRIRNTDNARQWYGHLSKVSVKKGEQVTAGQKIGEVGATGVVTGAHLHFETWSNSSVGSNFNPRVLFDRYDVDPGSAPASVIVKPSGKPSTSKQPTNYTKLAVDGKFGAKTIEALQIVLRAIDKYDGLVDGKAGALTWKAVQSWLSGMDYYDRAIDGKAGAYTIQALQRFLRKKGLYPTGYRIDGAFGPVTVKALQKYLNSQRG